MSSPIVSIITRTRDRPVLLERAMGSVLGQEDPPPMEWIVVNDAGDKATVENLLEPAKRQLAERLTLVHLQSSTGMEHASNQGIAHAAGKYLTIHDDDDTWEPRFLRKTTDWLEKSANAAFAGVVCHSMRIEESLAHDGVTIHRETPFNFWLKELSAWAILEQNPFPPISFLFRHSAFRTVGPFDETLPVLGDWEFNLRIILNWPIGVLPEPLARYHHRINTANGPEANSINAGHERHLEWDERLRKRWETTPPLERLPHFGAFSRIARASKDTRDATHRLLSLPIRPGPQV